MVRVGGVFGVEFGVRVRVGLTQALESWVLSSDRGWGWVSGLWLKLGLVFYLGLWFRCDWRCGVKVGVGVNIGVVVWVGLGLVIKLGLGSGLGLGFISGLG